MVSKSIFISVGCQLPYTDGMVFSSARASPPMITWLPLSARAWSTMFLSSVLFHVRMGPSVRS